MAVMQYNKNVFCHEDPILSMPADPTPEDYKTCNLVCSPQYSKLNTKVMYCCNDIDSAIFHPTGLGVRLTEFDDIERWLNSLLAGKNSLSNSP